MQKVSHTEEKGNPVRLRVGLSQTRHNVCPALEKSRSSFTCWDTPVYATPRSLSHTPTEKRACAHRAKSHLSCLAVATRQLFRVFTCSVERSGRWENRGNTFKASPEEREQQWTDSSHRTKPINPFYSNGYVTRAIKNTLWRFFYLADVVKCIF